MKKLLVVALAVVGLVFAGGAYYYSELNAGAKATLSNLQVPKKTSNSVLMTPTQVITKRADVTNALNALLADDWQTKKNGSVTERNKLRGLFVSTGSTVLGGNTTHKQLTEYYKPFSYELTNVAGKKVDGRYRLIANINVKQNGQPVNMSVSMIQVDLDKQGRVTNVELFSEAG